MRGPSTTDYRLTSLALATLLVPAAAMGQTENAEADSEPRYGYYGNINVTATGNEADTHQVAQPVIVLTEIDTRLADNAADLLRWEPGVDVDGVGAAQVRPVIRGLRGLRVLFLEDGLRMNNSRRQSDFGEITGLVPNELVERVEVVRGAASVLYGTDAVGGVINLVTTRPTAAGWSGTARITGGTTDDSLRAGVETTHRGDAWSWSAAAGIRDAEDYQAPAGSFGDITLAEDTTVLDTGVEDDFFRLGAVRDFSPSHSLSINARSYSSRNSGFGLVDPTLIGDDPTSVRIFYPRIEFTKLVLSHGGVDLGWASTLDTRVYAQSNERQFANDIDINIGPLFPGAPDSSVEIDTLNDSDMDTWGLRSDATRAAGAGLWTWGVEAFSDDSINTDHSVTTTTLRFPFPPFESEFTTTDDIANTPNATNSSVGGFGQYERLVGSNLHLSVGTRYQQVETRAEPTPGLDVDGLDFDDSRWVGAATLRYQALRGLQIVASMGSSFRAPGIVERLFNGPTPEGGGYQIINPALKSEKGLNWDLGLKYRGRRSFAELTLFENTLSDGIAQHFLSPAEIAMLPPDLQDEIDALGPGAFVVQQRNLEELVYSGLEAVAGYDFDSGASIGGNFTLLDADRTDSANPPTGETYDDKTSAWLRYDSRQRPWFIEYRVRYSSGGRAKLAPNQPPPVFGLELPSLFVQRLAAGWTFSGSKVDHQINLVVDNLSDRLYAEASNASFFRPQPGLGARLSYGVRF